MSVDVLRAECGVHIRHIDGNTSHTTEEGTHSPSWPNGLMIHILLIIYAGGSMTRLCPVQSMRASRRQKFTRDEHLSGNNLCAIYYYLVMYTLSAGANSLRTVSAVPIEYNYEDI